jgi:predicted  nucleic acid-binding Zn-ribbon protein
MDQELISYLDKRFDRIETDINELKTDVKELKVDVEGLKAGVKELEKDVHKTGILLEDLQDQVKLVAEGLNAVVEGFKTHRVEVAKEINGIRVLVQQSYSDLSRRVRLLEAPETDH